MRHHLVVALTLVLTSGLASAEFSSPPPNAQNAANTAKPATEAVALIKSRLLEPLAAKEHHQSKFSRARLPPRERRVRVLDEKPQQDSAGNAFYTYAIDARHGWSSEGSEADWTKAAYTGCAYPATGSVFIKRGNSFHPAVAATGKKTKPAPSGTCSAATQVSAR